MINDQFNVSPIVPVVASYNIDDGIGRDTTISVISKTVSDIAINVSGPANNTLSNSSDQVESMSLLLPDISQVG